MKEEDEAIKRAQKWLEDMSKGLGRELEALTLEGLQITMVRKGLVRCTLVIPQNVSDRDGNWDVGAMAVLIDDVAACAVASSYFEGLFVKASLDFHISFYSTPKIQEEVEVEAKIVGEKGRLKSVVVEVNKKENGEMIAVGKVWFATDTINRYHHRPTAISKL